MPDPLYPPAPASPPPPTFSSRCSSLPAPARPQACGPGHDQPRLTRRLALQTLGACALPAAGPAAARVAEGRPVSLVVSYPPGGGADLMARLIAPRMAEALGQPVQVENRPGAQGQVAGAYVAQAEADGRTLLLDASSFAVAPALSPQLPYDPAQAFSTLAVLALFPNVLVAHPKFAAGTVRALLAAARAKPGLIAYASSGPGSAQHMAGVLFEERAQVQLAHQPYPGGGPALGGVISGEVPLGFANLAPALQAIRQGQLRALAVTSQRRSPVLAQVPTMAQAGVPGYEVYEWNPVLAPAGLDAETRRQLIAAVAHAMAAPEVRARVLALGGEPFRAGADAADGFLRDQQQRWGRIVRERHIQAS